MNEIEIIFDNVAGELSWLEPAPVFLGGATIGLYLDKFGRAQLRPTKDIDCIVPGILSRTSWWKFEEQLRNHGWSPEPSGPICRYRSPNNDLVDFMTEDPAVLGFAGRWYPDATRGAQKRQLVTGRFVLVPSPEHLLACKLEAWRDRGQSDALMSQDLEDVVALLEGCRELEEQVLASPEELQVWIASALLEIIDNRDTYEAVIAHLPRGGDLASRERRVLSLLARLARRT